MPNLDMRISTAESSYGENIIEEEPAHVSEHAKVNRQYVLHSCRVYWAIKRAQDVFFSAIAIVILSPVMLITMLAIFIDDPHGSPIYVQDRVGRDGKIFRF